MPHRFLTPILFCLLIAGLVIGGCTYRRSPQVDLLKAYRQKMELQKSALEKEEGLAPAVELDAEGYEKLGDLYLKQGKRDLAFLQYNKALRMDPGRTHLRYRIGCLYLAKGLSEEAGKEFQEMVQLNPKDALPYEGIGRALFQSGKLPEAERSFQQALRLDPGLWQSHHFLALIYDRRKEFDKALDEYHEAIALKPNSFMLYHNLGISLFLSKNYEQAVSVFAHSLSLEPSNRRGLNNLALALSKLGRYEEALETLKKGGEEASAHYYLGCIYMMDEKYEEAVVAFEKAIEVKPVFYAEAHRNLVRARSVLSTLPKREETEQIGDKSEKEESFDE